MALPNAPATAYDGYTYSERICQEYGQQPRWYQVRNPIPGSDWRNDGGWAIVLERGSNVSPPVYSFSNPANEGSFSSRQGAFSNGLNSGANNFLASTTVGNLAPRTYITAPDGTGGWVRGFGGDLVFDRNGDGELTIDDMFSSGGLWYWERRTYAIVESGSNYGTQYIRWANLAWCR